MYNELFTVFGTTQFLLSGNGLHFTEQEVEAFIEHINVKHQYTTLYYPQTNGMVESVNGVIVKSLKKVVHERKLGWDVMLPAV